MTTASITAVAGLVVVMAAVLAVLGFPHLQHTKALPLSQLLDVLKLVLGTVAGVGALFALVMAYRRQRLAEVADDRDQQRALLDAQRAVLEQERALLEQRQAQEDRTRVFNERFGAASAQLGHDEPAVRLAGAYAMAGLADDWEQGRQTCIDVLCAFLRLPHTLSPGEDPAEGQDPTEHAAARATYLAAREVRHTVIRIIGNHLNGHTDVSWRGHDLDFTGAIFDGGDFRRAVFTSDATVSFQEARFEGGTVDFGGARFEGGTTIDFGGTVDFGGARFEGGTVDFDNAGFEGGTVDFGGARFEGGRVNFGYARFEGGVVKFDNAGFEGGTVDFDNARFEGSTIDFGYAGLVGGTVDFASAVFEAGTVNFRYTGFEGSTVNFGYADFKSGVVAFASADFKGGAINFDEATGRRPTGLPNEMAPHLS
ncbi:pentapeptide repeat-containing protein [Actinomadura napierensis]|uniref:pentapeptide repeat-containing protein n=1 Tax=Actinomadura napierensis TaxID=267854 RepID=UPI0031D5BB10